MLRQEEEGKGELNGGKGQEEPVEVVGRSGMNWENNAQLCSL